MVVGNQPQSLADWVVHYHLSLIDNAFVSGSRQILRQHARLFISDLTSFWGYEIPLSKFPAEPDFLFCVDNPFKLFEQLSDSDVSGPNSLITLNPIYKYYFELSAYWLKNQTKINNVWFEYDFKNLGEDHKPNFFYAPGDIPIVKQIATAKEIFGIMGDNMRDIAPYELLKKCYDHLPFMASISQIGRMLARGDQHIRLFIQSIPPNEINSFLQILGYNSKFESGLITLINDCEKLSSQVDIDIDLFDKIGDKIGLEVYFKKVENALLFLEYLHDKQMCVDKLYRYLTNHIDSIVLDPREKYQHFFSHFKIVYTPDQPNYAKAYVAFADHSIATNLIKIDHPKKQPS